MRNCFSLDIISKETRRFSEYEVDSHVTRLRRITRSRRWWKKEIVTRKT